MMCPVCGIGEALALWENGSAPTECANPQHDLLKHCPDCGKLFGMDDIYCDEARCDNRELEAPPSTWADVDGGVQRRRFVRTTGWSLENHATARAEITPWNTRFSKDAGDTLISAYGRLYMDSDPNVLGCRGDGDLIEFQSARPMPWPTSIVAHSGRVAVLSRTSAYLLDATNLIDLFTLKTSSNAQIIADGYWWLMGKNGITRLKLEDAEAGLEPETIWSEPCDDALPPVRLEQGSIWIPMNDGRQVVVNLDANVTILEPLPDDEQPFGAFCTDGLAVLLSHRGESGSAIRVWKLSALVGGDGPSQPPCFWDVKLRRTWGARDKTAYVCAANGHIVHRIRLEQLTYRSNEISVAADDPLEDLILLEDKLLIRTKNGQFRTIDAETERSELWNDAWSGRSIKSWAIWGDSIVAVLPESDHCRIVKIPRQTRGFGENL